MKFSIWLYFSAFLLGCSLALPSSRENNQILMSTESGAKVLMPIADGFEELEAITIIDILKRAGADVTVASVTQSNRVVGMLKTEIIVEALFKDVINTDYDLIVLAGGGANARTLASTDSLIKKLKSQKNAGKWYAAICASPAIVFAPHGLLDGVKATSFPGMDDYFTNANAVRSNQRVVVSHNCITSQGPGTAMEFAIELVRNVISQDKADSLTSGLSVCTVN